MGFPKVVLLELDNFNLSFLLCKWWNATTERLRLTSTLAWNPYLFDTACSHSLPLTSYNGHQKILCTILSLWLTLIVSSLPQMLGTQLLQPPPILHGQLNFHVLEVNLFTAPLPIPTPATLNFPSPWIVWGSLAGTWEELQPCIDGKTGAREVNWLPGWC